MNMKCGGACFEAIKNKAGLNTCLSCNRAAPVRCKNAKWGRQAQLLRELQRRRAPRPCRWATCSTCPRGPCTRRWRSPLQGTALMAARRWQGARATARLTPRTSPSPPTTGGPEQLMGEKVKTAELELKYTNSSTPTRTQVHQFGYRLQLYVAHADPGLHRADDG